MGDDMYDDIELEIYKVERELMARAIAKVTAQQSGEDFVDLPNGERIAERRNVNTRKQ